MGTHGGAVSGRQFVQAIFNTRKEVRLAAREREQTVAMRLFPSRRFSASSRFINVTFARRAQRKAGARGCSRPLGGSFTLLPSPVTGPLMASGKYLAPFMPASIKAT